MSDDERIERLAAIIEEARNEEKSSAYLARSILVALDLPILGKVETIPEKGNVIVWEGLGEK